MKIKTQVIIEADRETVWRVFDNPDNMTKWQPTLRSFTTIEGVQGQPGAVAELKYEENGREITLVERITERRDGYFMAGSYESDWGIAIIVNHFEDMPDGSTRWVGHWNYTFKGLFRFLAPFMRGSMRRRIDDDLQRFKLLVESLHGGN